jgi:hypothetical protein
MTSNDNATAQMLLFPIQEKEYSHYLSDDETVMQLRLDFSRWNNDRITGKRVFTEEEVWKTRKNLRIANEILLKGGFKPIVSPFDD